MEELLLGIPVKKYIDVDNSSEIIVVKENVKYKQDDFENYKQMFQDLVEDALIISGSFEDDEWVIEKDDYGYITFKFDIGINPKINTVLKCYIVLKFAGRNSSVSNAYTSLSALKKTLISTNFFNIKNLVDYRDSIPTWSYNEKQYLYYVKEFIRYYNFNAGNEYYDVINKVSIPKSKIRLLPSYKSILIFDFILTDYLDNSSIEEKEKYFPLLLWWKLTKIIPMRPIEFNILSRNCCSYDKKTKTYYIEIERKKQRNGVIKYKKIPDLNKIKITKEIFDMFQEYATLVDPENKSPRLLSYNSYNKYLTEYIKEFAYKSKIDPQIMNIIELRTLLRKFYNEVVAEKYEFIVIEKDDMSDELKENVIERIQLGDTRHLAFCSMMLQGFNPLTIAQLGGHYTLREQMSYYSHLETFIDAHTFALAKSIKSRLNKNFSDLNLVQDYRMNTLTKFQLGDEFYKLRKIKGGRCKSRNFPYECTEIDECLFCNHFVMDETLSNDLVLTVTEKLNKEINAKLEYIRNISNNMAMNLNKAEYDLQAQETLKTYANALDTLMNKKAILEVYKMKLNEV